MTGRNLVRGFGILDSVPSYLVIILAAVLVGIWAVLQFLVWTYLKFDKKLSAGQTILQVLITGGTLASVMDIIPDPIAPLGVPVGLSDDAIFLVLSVIGGIKTLFWALSRRSNNA